MVVYDETVIRTYILHCYLRVYKQLLLLHVAIYLYTKLASGATSAFHTSRFVLTDHFRVVCSVTWPLNGSEALDGLCFDTDLTAFAV